MQTLGFTGQLNTLPGSLACVFPVAFINITRSRMPKEVSVLIKICSKKEKGGVWHESKAMSIQPTPYLILPLFFLSLCLSIFASFSSFWLNHFGVLYF